VSDEPLTATPDGVDGEGTFLPVRVLVSSRPTPFRPSRQQHLTWRPHERPNPYRGLVYRAPLASSRHTSCFEAVSRRSDACDSLHPIQSDTSVLVSLPRQSPALVRLGLSSCPPFHRRIEMVGLPSICHISADRLVDKNGNSEPSGSTIPFHSFPADPQFRNSCLPRGLRVHEYMEVHALDDGCVSVRAR
jgi:hypothetical protein